uniref:AfsR/SARP family transcriptional regulator n=1 Tax=Streptomyces asoensis TaxID=249586 RepID=UPI00209C2EC4|nr:BTAD domain-containing putative transcriptional regulator [Streptomyces asoensis]
MRFEVLGPVRVWREERELDPGFPQQRALLALLLAHAGRPVPTSGIVDVLWAERPPASALNVVRRYVGAVRRLLEPGLPPRAPGRRLLRRTGGYVLEAATDEVDLLRFRELTRQGKRAAATGRPETAARQFVLALGEWRGPVAMGIPASAREHVQFTAVQRELLETARLAADSALLCGHAEQALPALRRATAHDPLDESLHARLVLVLAACGLQAEALGAYEDVRRRLARELGLTPGTELAAAHTRVLRQDLGHRLRRGPAVHLGRPIGTTRTTPTPAPTPPPPTEPPTPGPAAPDLATPERTTRGGPGIGGPGPGGLGPGAPGVGAPGVGAPGVGGSATRAPGVGGSATRAPGTGAPATVAPGTGAPGVGAPATVAPGIGAPGTGAPATVAPGIGAPGTGAPATVAPGTGAPGTGAPGTGAPGTGTPGIGAPGTGAPGTGTPGIGTPGTGAPGTGGPGIGAPGAEAPGTGTPGPEGSGVGTVASGCAASGSTRAGAVAPGGAAAEAGASGAAASGLSASGAAASGLSASGAAAPGLSASHLTDCGAPAPADAGSGPTTQDLAAQSLAAQDLATQDPTAQSLAAQSLAAQDLAAQSLAAQGGPTAQGPTGQGPTAQGPSALRPVDPGPTTVSSAGNRAAVSGLVTPVEGGGLGRMNDAPAGRGVVGFVRPAQLPSALPSFVGRVAESDWLERAAGSAAGIVLVGGMAGIGKSTLALHWAHRATDRFPDGQLYMALRGSDPARPAVEPADALRGMLAALGVPAPRMPDGVDALTGMYRTLLARRRVLVVLDDAAGTGQLSPLLPTGPGCLALVTSRHALPGLVASGARPLRLAPPSPEDAYALLAGRIGAERVAAEPRAADEIVARCGRLPLALATVAARAVSRRDFPLAAVAAALREAHGSLDALAATREAFLGSYRLLTPDSARLFRLLPRHEGPDITPAGAAALAGLPVRRARLLLGVLADAHLLTEPAPGRYTLHDLLRVFATERAAAEGRPRGR